MKFFITHSYYGGDVNIIKQAAQDNNAELIAVKGYALEDFPDDREYVEGSAEYIFTLERNSKREALQTVDILIRIRVRELILAQEASE